MLNILLRSKFLIDRPKHKWFYVILKNLVEYKSRYRTIFLDDDILLRCPWICCRLFRPAILEAGKQGWAKLVLIALERYSVALKRLTFNLR